MLTFSRFWFTSISWKACCSTITRVLTFLLMVKFSSRILFGNMEHLMVSCLTTTPLRQCLPVTKIAQGHAASFALFLDGLITATVQETGHQKCSRVEEDTKGKLLVTEMSWLRTYPHLLRGNPSLWMKGGLSGRCGLQKAMIWPTLVCHPLPRSLSCPTLKSLMQ